MTGLPGAELIEQGILDLRRGVDSVPALLVSIGHPRLRQILRDLPPPVGDSPEHRLYEQLSRSEPERAHSAYNALIRRLVSFERAAECAR